MEAQITFARKRLKYRGESHLAKGEACTFQVMRILLPQRSNERTSRSTCEQNGVAIRQQTRVEDFVVNGKNVESLVASDDQLKFDEFVIATGAWSGVFCSKLGIDLPMQSGKGL